MAKIQRGFLENPILSSVHESKKEKGPQPNKSHYDSPQQHRFWRGQAAQFLPSPGWSVDNHFLRFVITFFETSNLVRALAFTLNKINFRKNIRVFNAFDGTTKAKLTSWHFGIQINSHRIWILKSLDSSAIQSEHVINKSQQTYSFLLNRLLNFFKWFPNTFIVY